ncbi:MAG: hypothetical protein KUG77_29870 [Nannocystaceae bacterium]|nr:hypothetical protein [Nannocystaceae bacterium]
MSFGSKGTEDTSALVAKGDAPLEPWSGDEHQIRSSAAKEAGLDATAAEADFLTDGFKAGIVVQDPLDGAIVARGRTVLKETELFSSLRPALQYLGVRKDDYKVRVTGGRFELRVSKQVAEQSSPVMASAKLALQTLVGFGIVGFVAYQWLPQWVAGIVWGFALMAGGWQLRQGLVSGRALLGARLAVALGLLAQEEQLILPPASGDLGNLKARS